MSTHEEIELRKSLPRVGDVVRSKRHGTLWQVMEKRLVWTQIDLDRLTPAIYLSYWQIKEGQPPGVGKMVGFMYTAYDNTFEANWEMVQK